MKKQTITLRGPFPAYPDVSAMMALGYTEVATPPINVFRVEKTMNTLTVLPGRLVNVDQSLELIADEDFEVHVLAPKDGEQTYIRSVDEWLKMGGSKA